MKFWKNNQADAEFDLPEAEVARLFAESRWADQPWPLERRLRAFLTDPHGPISAVWEDEAAFDEVRRLAALPPGAAAGPDVAESTGTTGDRARAAQKAAGPGRPGAAS